MARKQRPAGLDWSQRKKVWEAASVTDWFLLLQKIAPQNKWTRNGQSMITGLCPYHDEKTPSFKLTFPQKLGKCFGCGKAVTDMVQLVAKLRGTTYEAALIFLNEELGLEKVIGKDTEKLAQQHRLEEMKKEAAMAFGKVVEEYVRDHPAHLSYMDSAAAYLENARNVPLAMVPNLPLAIYPKPAHVKKYLPRDYHEDYEKYFEAVNNERFWGDLIFWYNDTPGTISNFKLRRKSKDIEALCGTGKPGDLDHKVARALFSKDFIIVKDPIERPLGVFGLHHYSRLISDHNTTAVITEGEFDALAVMIGQLKNGSTLDFPIFAVGGGAGSGGGFQFLKDFWIRTIYIVTDAPGDKKGIELAYSWLCGVKDDDNAIRYRVFIWPAEMMDDAGDLDDAVQKHGYEYVRSQIWADAKNNYLNQFDWVKQQCSAAIKVSDAGFRDMEEAARTRANSHKVAESDDADDADDACVDDRGGCDNEIKNIRSDRDIKRREIVGEWLKAIANKADKSIFVNTFSALLGVDLTVLDEVYNDINDVNTPQGAMRVVSAALFNLVSIPFYEVKGGKAHHTIYSKMRDTHRSLIIGKDNDFHQALSEYVGNDLTEWMKGLLRNSVVITPTEEEKNGKYLDNPMAVRNEEVKRSTALMQFVMNTYASKFEDKKNLTKVGQGIHYHDLLRNNCVYVLNGTKVFKGTLNPPSGASIEWERIRDIKDGEFYFLADKEKEWSETVQDVQDLYYGLQVDLNKTYNKIIQVVGGWRFENHEVMSKYIAAWILSLPIQLATGRVNLTYITGESTSGKTSFLQGLLGGRGNVGHDVPYILEASSVKTDATEAYIYQSMDASSLVLGLDEAETGDTLEHNKRMQNINKQLYSVPTGGSMIGRGTASGSEFIEYKLRSPVVLAAIHIPTDDTYLTRVMVLYTKKQYRHRNIGDYMQEVIDEAGLVELRKSITTGLLARIPEVMNRTRALDEKLGTIRTSPPVTSRFINSVSTVLAIYEMCGTEQEPHDPVDLYKEVIQSNRTRLEAVLASDSKSPLIDHVLFAKCVSSYKLNSSGDSAAPRDLIVSGTNDEINVLNNSRTGVYLLKDRGWIVLYWRQIKSSILNHSINSYREYSEGALRESISKNRYLINPITQEDHEYIINELGIVDAKTVVAYSVISVEYLLSNADVAKPGEAKAISKENAGPTAFPSESAQSIDDQFEGFQL